MAKPESRTEKDSFFEERLIGSHHYKTTISNGTDRVVGHGNTPEDSQKIASEKWKDYDKKRDETPSQPKDTASSTDLFKFNLTGRSKKTKDPLPIVPDSSHDKTEYCPVCGSEYDGSYCYSCDDDDDYYNEEESYEPQKPTRQQVIVERLTGKKESELMEIVMKNEEEDLKSAALERLVGIRDSLYISKYTSPQRLKKLSDSGEIGLYSGVTFVPPTFLVTYKCNRCGHEWDSTWNEFGLPKELINCMMGCSNGANNPSLLGLYKIIKGLITGKEPFGYGRLIRSKEL